MSSIDKMKLLMEFDRKGSKLKITSIRDEVFICRLHAPAEDEESWAYDIITLDNPPKHFVLECNYIKSIEEISD